MLKNAPTLAIRGVDTEENEHCEVCPLSVYRSPRFLPTKLLDVKHASMKVAIAQAWEGRTRLMLEKYKEGVDARLKEFQEKLSRGDPGFSTQRGRGERPAGQAERSC